MDRFNPFFSDFDYIGQTLIEYPTLYFGSYEHTDRLNTLIRSNNNMEDDNNTDTTTAATGIAVLQHNTTTTIHNDSPDPEEMEEAQEEEVGLNTLAIGKNMIDSTGKVGRNTKKVVTYSQDLLGIGSKKITNNSVQNDTQSLGSLGTPPAVIETAVVDEEDNLEHIVPRISSSLPTKPVGGAINSSNVAQLVGNMKHFIESTLAEKEEEQLKQLQQGDNQLISATGNSIENMFKTSNHSSNSCSTSSNIKHKAITSNRRVSNTNNSSMVEEEEGEVVEEGENEVVDEEVDEEFLAALKDLADKDIDTLRAIIAAAEQEEEEEGEESDSSDAEED